MGITAILVREKNQQAAKPSSQTHPLRYSALQLLHYHAATPPWSPQEDLSAIKKRISEIMTEVDKEKAELDEILLFISTIDLDDAEFLLNMGTSTLLRRKKQAAKQPDGAIYDYEQKRIEKEESLKRMWLKIHELQAQERELETKLNNAGS